jgi:hypothetical protein
MEDTAPMLDEPMLPMFIRVPFSLRA